MQKYSSKALNEPTGTGYGAYLGNIKRSYLFHSRDESLSGKVASGGAVSSIVIHLLKLKIIDAALVCRCAVADGKIGYDILLAENKDEVLSCATSKYYDIPLLEALNKLKAFNGRIAFVGLPCQVSAISKIIPADSELGKKITLKIGLFCGHLSKKELMEYVLGMKGVDLREVDKLYFRRGLWRGKTEIIKKSGETISFPFGFFGLYQNLFLFSEEKCLHCHDHTSEEADISCGDAWLWRLRNRKKKYSVVCCRNEKAEETVRQVIDAGEVDAEEINAHTVFESQRRALIFHKSINARAKIGGLFGVNIKKCPCAPRPRINDYLSNLIALTNFKITNSPKTKNLIFLVPRPILFVYLLVFKLLTNF